MSKTKAAETLRNGEQKGRWVCARLTDLVSLVLAKLCGFFSQLCTCVTHSRLFISVGMVEPQGKPKYFIERLVVGFGWVWYWLVVVWFFFFTCPWYIVCSPKKALCVPQKSGWGHRLWPARAPHSPEGSSGDYSWSAPPFRACWVSAAACGPGDHGIPGTISGAPASPRWAAPSPTPLSPQQQQPQERWLPVGWGADGWRGKPVVLLLLWGGGGFLGLFVRLFSVWQVNELD